MFKVSWMVCVLGTFLSNFWHYWYSLRETFLYVNYLLRHLRWQNNSQNDTERYHCSYSQDYSWKPWTSNCFHFGSRFWQCRSSKNGFEISNQKLSVMFLLVSSKNIRILRQVFKALWHRKTDYCYTTNSMAQYKFSFRQLALKTCWSTLILTDMN